VPQQERIAVPEHSEVTARAIAILDAAGDPWQWQDVANKLPIDATSLKYALPSQYDPTLETYNRYDSNVHPAEERDNRVAAAGTFLRRLVILVGVAFLLPLEDWFPELWRKLQPEGPVLLLQMFSLALLSLVTYYRTTARTYFKWQSEVAKAQLAQKNSFEAVVRAKPAHPEAGLPLLPLQLEYFRRFQLDRQRLRSGYQAKALAKAAGLEGWRRYVNIALVLAAFASIAYVVMAVRGEITVPGGDLAKISFARGIIVCALFGAIVSRSYINKDEADAHRYLAIKERLDALAGEPLQYARQAAVVREDHEAVIDFVRLVHDAMFTNYRVLPGEEPPFLDLAQRDRSRR